MTGHRLPLCPMKKENRAKLEMIAGEAGLMARTLVAG